MTKQSVHICSTVFDIVISERIDIFSKKIFSSRVVYYPFVLLKNDAAFNSFTTLLYYEQKYRTTGFFFKPYTPHTIVPAKFGKGKDR